MANFYRIGAGGLNWKNTGSWSSTSGGASNGVDEPSSSDAVFFDTNSPTSVTVSAAAVGASCSLTKSGLTITLNGGSVTISGTTTIATNAQVINKTAAETWSSSGFTANTSITGTAKIILTGGTWSGTSSILNDLDLQGTITISGNVFYRSGTLRYVSGTITVTSSTLKITGSCTLNTSTMSWNNVSTTVNSPTITLASNFVATGTFTCFDSGTANTTTTTINKTTSEKWICAGITCNNRIAGTATIELTGGTWSSGLNSNNIYIQNNLNIAGNVTLSNNVSFNTGTMTYVSGTVTTTGSTLTVGFASTFDTNGITFSTIVIAPSITITINSTLSSTTIDLSTGNNTFVGTAGFNCATLTCSATTASTITLKNLVTYTITSSFSCYQSRIGSIILFTSDHASNRANILMPNNGNNSCNILASFTRIDATGGRTINTYGGTITDCLNVQSYTDYKVTAI